MPTPTTERVVASAAENGRAQAGFDVPLAATIENGVGGLPGAFDATTVAAALTRPRILLVGIKSDGGGYAQLLAACMAVEFAAASEALAAARRAPHDLVILDSGATMLDGLHILQEMRADPQLLDIPVIFISSHSEPRAVANGSGFSPDDHLIHPFSPQELIARVTLNLRIASLRRQAAAALHASEVRVAAEANALVKLNEATLRLWRLQSERAGLEEMLASSLELVGADMGVVQVLDSQDGELVLAAHYGIEPPIIEPLRAVMADERSACGRALRAAERVVIEDIESDPLYAPFRPVARAAGFRAILSVPLVGRNGTPLGMLSTKFRSVYRPSEQDLRRLDLYARQAADFLERCRGDEALRESERRFRATFENAAVGIAHVSPDGTLMRVNSRLCEIIGWSAEELASKTFQGITHPEDLEKNLGLFEQVLSGNLDTYAMEKRYLRKDGTIVWANLTVGCVRKADGAVDYFISVIEDITERKQAEEHTRLLLREVNHRSKNLLAVVQAVARQTAGDSDPKVFAKRFAARLSGLAACQDLLVKNDWREVDISDLFRTQLAHFAGLIGTRILPEGPPLKLSPAAAQTIGMALHELATNAGKYGALSTAKGIIGVSWALSATNGSSRFSMEWLERGGPPVREPDRRGFGHTVLVRMVEYDLGAEVAMEHAPDGLVWRLSAPTQSILSRPNLRLGAGEGLGAR